MNFHIQCAEDFPHLGLVEEEKEKYFKYKIFSLFVASVWKAQQVRPIVTLKKIERKYCDVEKVLINSRVDSENSASQFR